MDQGTEIKPGFALWFTGLPSSGKSTVAQGVARRLLAAGIPVQILDSDELRTVLTPDPTYSSEEREWFYGVLVFIAGLLVDNGANVIIAATGARRAYRERGRARLPWFAEVFVDCPLPECQARDPKGLWQRSARGEIDTLPGATVPYELPLAPEVRVDTATQDPEESVDSALGQLQALDFFGAQPPDFAMTDGHDSPE